MKTQFPLTLQMLSAVCMVTILCSSCGTPANLNFESARMLNKGSVEVQGNASAYAGGGADSYSSQINLGFKMGLGISDQYNLKLRTEKIITHSEDVSVNNIYLFEVDNKLKLREAVALSLPLGIFTSFDTKPEWQFNPRVYATFLRTKHVELTLIPKCHILYYNHFQLSPGISLGAGFSSNFNRWVLRPEVGYNSAFSAGMALSLFLW